jgi:hypothetical protein
VSCSFFQTNCGICCIQLFMVGYLNLDMTWNKSTASCLGPGHTLNATIVGPRRARDFGTGPTGQRLGGAGSASESQSQQQKRLAALEAIEKRQAQQFWRWGMWINQKIHENTLNTKKSAMILRPKIQKKNNLSIMNNGLNRLLVYWNTNQLAEVSSQQLPKSGDITRKYWDDDHVYRIIFRLYHINIYIYIYVY